MASLQRYRIKKIIVTALWLAMGMGSVVLLVAAIKKKESSHCKKIEIKIVSPESNKVSEEKFIDEKDILATLKNICKGNPIGKAIASVNLQKIEGELKNNKWVNDAQLFFDNANILNVSIVQRIPIARIFTTSGASFYIDSALTTLPLSDKFSVRLPLFTNFTGDKIILSSADSNLLRQVKNISKALQKNSFIMSMIEQVDITPEQNFEMIPKMGNQIIYLGNANDIEEKFAKLQLFYKNIMVKTGWSKYSSIHLQYKNQVVAKIRGAEEKSADSAKALQIMQWMAANAAKQASDSIQTIVLDNKNNTSDSSIILQSMQREEETSVIPTFSNSVPQQKNNLPPTTEKINAAPVEKLTPKKLPINTIKKNNKPKIAIQNKNDY